MSARLEATLRENEKLRERNAVLVRNSMVAPLVERPRPSALVRFIASVIGLAIMLAWVAIHQCTS